MIFWDENMNVPFFPLYPYAFGRISKWQNFLENGGLASLSPGAPSGKYLGFSLCGFQVLQGLPVTLCTGWMLSCLSCLGLSSPFG